MNDQLPPEDALARAARALRDASEARADGSPSQRGQILARAHANQQSAERRAAVGMALSAVLVTSTAIAAATGNLPKVVAVVQRAVGLTPAEIPATAPTVHEAGTPAVRRIKVGRQAEQLHALEPVADTQETPAPQPPAIPPTVPPPAEKAPAPALADQAKPPKLRPPVDVARRAEPAPKSLATEPVAAPNDPPPAEAQPTPPAVSPAPPVPVADETLALFRSAQTLQFRDKAYGKALVAWEAYLRAAPGGALAPEARWNRAVCLLRLGRKAEARIALEPFAQGMESGYRQAEAARLIAALQEGEP